MRTDEMIKKDVVEELTRDARVDAAKIEVSVTDDVVRLNGKVPSLLGKSSATEDAMAILGVTEVVNQMVVSYPAGTVENNLVIAGTQYRVRSRTAARWAPAPSGGSRCTQVKPDGWRGGS